MNGEQSEERNDTVRNTSAMHVHVKMVSLNKEKLTTKTTHREEAGNKVLQKMCVRQQVWFRKHPNPWKSFALRSRGFLIPNMLASLFLPQVVLLRSFFLELSST